MTKMRKNNCPMWNNTLVKGSYYYDERMQGYTGIFEEFGKILKARIYTNINFHYVIIEVKLGGVKYEAELSGNKTFIGNDIQSIKELYTDKGVGHGITLDLIKTK